MYNVAVAVLARDNERDIAECLESVSWADERIVILDTRSRDATAEIAGSLGAQVVPHRFKDFGRQREFGLTLPKSEWLFFVDTDERATPELAGEVRRAVRDDERVGWWVPRRNHIWGREVRYGGWYPDYQLRLLRVGRAHYDLKREVHEIVHLSGRDGHLENPLLHINYRTFAEFVRKQRQYVSYEADILYQQGVRPRPRTFVSQPLREFWRRYLTLQGYKDGPVGLALCLLVAYYYGFVVTLRLAERVRGGARE